MSDSASADEEVRVVDEDVAAVVSDLTGVPVGSMLSDVSKMATRLEQTLAERVVGQDDALARCASRLERTSPVCPIGAGRWGR